MVDGAWVSNVRTTSWCAPLERSPMPSRSSQVGGQSPEMGTVVAKLRRIAAAGQEAAFVSILGDRSSIGAGEVRGSADYRGEQADRCSSATDTRPGPHKHTADRQRGGNSLTALVPRWGNTGEDMACRVSGAWQQSE